MEFSYVKDGEEDHPVVLGKIEKMKITKKITCLDDEKRLTWYKIIPDETNDISGYVVRLTLENDYKFPRFLRSKYSEHNQKNLMYNTVNNINKYIYGSMKSISIGSSCLAMFPKCQISNDNAFGDNILLSCSDGYYLDRPELFFNQQDGFFYTLIPSDKVKCEPVIGNKRLKYFIPNFQRQIAFVTSKEDAFKANLWDEEFVKIQKNKFNNSVNTMIRDYMDCQFSLASIVKDKKIDIGFSETNIKEMNSKNTDIYDVGGLIVFCLNDKNKDKEV